VLGCLAEAWPHLNVFMDLLARVAHAKEIVGCWKDSINVGAWHGELCGRE
jgi:hypothetical protein